MFRKAERQSTPLKLAITGPSGSGKTFSSLRIAFGLGEKVAMLDTENRSGALYADVRRDGIGEYDIEDIFPPFTTDKYVAGIRAAQDAGYDVLIIDSISPHWSGTGGLLEQKERLDKGGGGKNNWANWAPVTKLHNQFLAALLEAQMHVICTIRSKVEYAQNEATRKVEKLGLQPVQREGVDYEFTVVFDCSQDHTAVASKDRTGLFELLNERLTEGHGRKLREWLQSGQPYVPAPAPASRAAAAVAGAERPLDSMVSGAHHPEAENGSAGALISHQFLPEISRLMKEANHEGLAAEFRGQLCRLCQPPAKNFVANKLPATFTLKDGTVLDIVTAAAALLEKLRVKHTPESADPEEASEETTEHYEEI